MSDVQRVFIIGLPRSGTTWMMWLLAQHPEVVALQQSGMFLPIKRMEEWFGVSYPTIKNRLNLIASKLEFSEMRKTAAPISGGDVLQRLGAGEITVDEAEAALKN